jgi:hypothetical protein
MDVGLDHEFDYRVKRPQFTSGAIEREDLFGCHMNLKSQSQTFLECVPPFCFLVAMAENFPVH